MLDISRRNLAKRCNLLFKLEELFLRVVYGKCGFGRIVMANGDFLRFAMRKIGARR